MKPIREGALFKRIALFGTVFEIRYGYYAEFERESEFHELIPIYPDFINDPVYTEKGFPFVTQMQDPCKHAESKNPKQKELYCVDCRHFVHGDELIGTCHCEQNRRTT